MGHPHSKDDSPKSPRVFPLGVCLRKGCGRNFAPSRWNQRYCQAADCMHQVKRWLARKRQRQCRQSEEQRQRHSERERQRRARKRQAQTTPPPAISAGGEPAVPISSSGNSARGHAAEQIPEQFCDRPGCYAPVRDSCRARSRYCGDSCRNVMRRVLDRERKWLCRKTMVGFLKRQLEYQRRRQRAGTKVSRSCSSRE